MGYTGRLCLKITKSTPQEKKAKENDLNIVVDVCVYTHMCHPLSITAVFIRTYDCLQETSGDWTW